MTWKTAHRTLPRQGEQENGDAVLIRRAGDVLLLAVVDGLGHGPQAAAAAAAGIRYLEAWRPGELEDGMRGLHEALKGTRGAAAGVCLLRGASMVCCGVGNVEIRCVGAKLPILLSPGVLGARVQSFRICRCELPRTCRVVLFSDGISFRAPLDALRDLEPDAACEALILDYRKPDDDASVVICDREA